MAAFVPGLVMLGVGLIGEWLLGPKSPTQKPSDMPQLNTALRGSPYYVTFGANRVYAQIGWTKNFKPVRNKSSGKGAAKGGGSGGFGSAKGGGAAGQNYEYFWDMLFNYGFMDQPAMIRQGWVGGDPIDAKNIITITGGASVTVSALLPVIRREKDTKYAKLKFTESFVAPGYITGDSNLATWAYFQSQEGVACAFPGTAWAGFNHLDLGQAPTVPQLSFEWVPLSVGFRTGTGGYVTTIQNDAVTNYAMNVDDNGQLYTIDSFDGSNSGDPVRLWVFKAVNGVTTATATLHDVAFGNDCVALGFAANQTDVSYEGNFAIPGTKYIWVSGRTSWGVNRVTQIMVQYCINTDGTITRQGGFQYRYGNLAGGLLSRENASPIYIAENGSVVIAYNSRASGIVNSGANGSWIAVFDGPSHWTVGTYDDTATTDTTVQMYGRTLELQELAGDGFWNHFSDRVQYYGNASFVPSVTPNAPHLFSYVCKGDTHWHNNHTSSDTGWSTYVGSISGANPNGCMVKIEITSLTPFGLTYAAPVVDNNYFNDAVGNALIPFSDALHGFTGTVTTDYNDDWQTPTVFGTSGELLACARGYSDNDGYASTYLFVNDGTKATAIGPKLTGQYATVAQLGGGNPSDPINISVTGTTDGQIYFVVDYLGGGGNPGKVIAKFGGTDGSSADVTPAYVIYRILTSPIFGFATQALFGYATNASRIDNASYLAAVQWCVANGIYISVTYTQADQLLTILNELLALYGGYLVDQGGFVKFGVVKGDGLAQDGTSTRTLDNNHFVVDQEGQPPVQVQKAALEDGYNKIKFSYIDRALDYKPNQVEVADEVDVDVNGPRDKVFPARYVMAGSLAQQIAVRALWANLYGKDTYSFKLGWKDADLAPGELVTLVDSFDPILNGGVKARITNWNNSKRGVYDVVAVREFSQYVTASAFFTDVSSIDPGWATLVDSAQVPSHQTAYELPQEFQTSKAQVFFGYNQLSMVMGAQLYISKDGANYILTQDTQPFIISGKTAGPLENRPQGYCDEFFEFYMMPSGSFTVSSPTFCQTHDLDDVTQAIRASGGGVFIVGSEAISVENLTLLGQNHYRARRAYRGWGGTPISAHTSGDYFHYHSAGIFAHEIALDDVGTNISYKIAPYNFAGDVVDISSIAASSYHILGYYWLPRVQPRFKIFVSSTQNWDASHDVTGPYIGVWSGDANTPAGSDIALTWSQAAQTEGFGAGGYGNPAYGHFLADVGTPSWRIDVSSINGTKVSSFVVNTPFFQYTRTQNSADFTGFGKDLVLKVTPYNVKGDGPVGYSRSLSMNW